MDLISVFYILFLFFVVVTVMYEGLARSNNRTFSRYGLPTYKKTIHLQALPELPSHVAAISDRLTPKEVETAHLSRFNKIMMASRAAPHVLVLPTSQTELAFRQGTTSRGRIYIDTKKSELTVIGYFTWPSLAVPFVMIFISFLFPFILLFLLIGIIGTMISEREFYGRVATAVGHEFQAYQWDQIV